MPSTFGPVAVNVNTGALEYSASVGSGQITDGSVDTADLADSAVTNAKVSASAAIVESKLSLTAATGTHTSRHAIGGADAITALSAILNGRLKTGYYYTLPTASVAGNAGLNVLRAYPYPITKSVTLDRIGIEVTTLGAATAVVRLGIYADDGNGIPGTLVLDAGTIDATSTGFKEITISQALTPGTYYFAGVEQGATSSVNCSTAVIPGIGSSTSAGLSTSAAAAFDGTGGGISGALPGTWTNATAPANIAYRVLFRAA